MARESITAPPAASLPRVEIAPAQGRCAPRFERVRRAFEASFAKGELGAAVAVYQDGDPVVDLWGGHADAARTRPWARDTLVCLASTTKGATAVCLHRLVDGGRLDLDAPVARVWPEFEQAGKAALPVRWLLSHQAGLPAIREPLPPEALFDWKRMTEALAAERPYWEPGSRHGYHALTFGHLVGEVLRRSDGRSLGTFLRAEIAAPLGLDLHVGVPEADLGRCAEIVPLGARAGARNKLHARMRDASTLVGQAFRNPPRSRTVVNTLAWRRAEIPAANGHATAHAVARLYAALARGGELDGVRLLSPATLARAASEAAFGPDAVLVGLHTRFGLGFMLGHRGLPLGPSPRAFGHPGMGGSIGFADPDARIGFGYVTNRMQSGLAGDARGFALIAALYASF
jgi:CubicO group peptidase (beta-lactamase class C family)